MTFKGGILLKFKSDVKRTRKPNFWPKYTRSVPEEIKEKIYQQYYSQDKLYIYCDMSMNLENNSMSVACTYITNGTITIKTQYAHPPRDCIGKNGYGELKAVTFALKHFEKYVSRSTEIIIYSDVQDIGQKKFKNTSFESAQQEINILLSKTKLTHPNKTISIQYLSNELKKYNPFYKSAHNAARKLIQT